MNSGLNYGLIQCSFIRFPTIEGQWLMLSREGKAPCTPCRMGLNGWGSFVEEDLPGRQEGETSH